MNQRIQELSEQAEKYADEWFRGEPTWSEAFESKFAELIVRECADACYKHKDLESFGIYPVRVAMVTKACSDNIKEHFGIEDA